MANRLQHSSSPYLQQHKDNPVDWYPWGAEALERSRAENRPIFLSIGYSSCHWCHVMERESFSNIQVAEVLNSKFVPIKVDREERPDLDHIYMQAVQMTTGSGGWPLNVFLTPDLRPFYGGTYFPPEAKFGRPAFRDLLMRISDIFTEQQKEVRQNADQLTAVLIQESRFFKKVNLLDRAPIEKVMQNLEANYEAEYGGLGAAPKFFYSSGFRLMLSKAKGTKNSEMLKKVEHTLTCMAQGGVYDQVGGGFHRYSTDAAWKVPHFEKMLYDNALLARLYLEAWNETKNEFYREICEEILNWALREMRMPDGAFYSAIDADSEHEEGLFYSWTWDELKNQFDNDQLEKIQKACDISLSGNFESRNILHFKKNVEPTLRSEVKSLFRDLLSLREKRIRPLTDTKSLCSWNGLMLSALALAGRDLQNLKYTESAKQISDLWWEKARPEGRLSHCLNGGVASKESFLEDYAFFLQSQIDLWEATGELRFKERSHQLAAELLEHFEDKEDGGFWAGTATQSDLLLRYKEIFDGALPAPYHLAVHALLRMWNLSAEEKYFSAAEKAMKAVGGSALENPGGFNSFAIALEDYFRFLEIGCQGENCKVS